MMKRRLGVMGTTVGGGFWEWGHLIAWRGVLVRMEGGVEGRRGGREGVEGSWKRGGKGVAWKTGVGGWHLQRRAGRAILILHHCFQHLQQYLKRYQREKSYLQLLSRDKVTPATKAKKILWKSWIWFENHLSIRGLTTEEGSTTLPMPGLQIEHIWLWHRDHC